MPPEESTIKSSDNHPFIAFRNVVLVVLLTSAAFWLVWFLSNKPHQSIPNQLIRQKSRTQQTTYGQTMMNTARSESLLAPLPEGVTVSDLSLTAINGDSQTLYKLMGENGVLIIFTAGEDPKGLEDFKQDNDRWQKLNIKPVVVAPPEIALKLNDTEQLLVFSDNNQALSQTFGVVNPENNSQLWPSVFWIKPDKTIGYEKSLPVPQLPATSIIYNAIRSRI